MNTSFFGNLASARHRGDYVGLKNNDPMLLNLKLLDDIDQNEKDVLVAEGFCNWRRSHYTSFVRASAKHGRVQYDAISADVGKSEGEVRAYARAFWNKEIGEVR